MQEPPEPGDAGWVEPVGGLVQHEQLGVAEQGGGEPEPLAHPKRIGAHRPVGGSLELDQLQQFLDAVKSDAGRERERPQVVAARAPRIEVARFEQCPDPAGRLVELAVALAEHQRLAGGRLRQPEQQPQGGRLAGAVGAKEASDRAALEREREPIDRGHGRHTVSTAGGRSRQAPPWRRPPSWKAPSAVRESRSGFCMPGMLGHRREGRIVLGGCSIYSRWGIPAGASWR